MRGPENPHVAIDAPAVRPGQPTKEPPRPTQVPPLIPAPWWLGRPPGMQLIPLESTRQRLPKKNILL